VGVRLLRAGSCASIWFRFRGSVGYQVRICPTVVLVGTHKDSTTAVVKTLPLDRPIGVGEAPTRIRVSAFADMVEVARDGVVLGTAPLTDADVDTGRFAIGIFTEQSAAQPDPPFEVAFDHVKIWSLSS
jgi:hypothetical protein